MRNLRRHHSDRMKARVERIVKTWSIVPDLTPRNIGRLAAMHATHVCKMCHFEKIFKKTKRIRVTMDAE